MRRYRRNVTQPSDIAFLLILFFLVLTGAVVDRALTIASSEVTIAHVQESLVIITVDTAGVARLGQSHLDPSLRTQIQGKAVIVEASADTRWDSVVAALSTVTDYGADSVSLSMGKQL